MPDHWQPAASNSVWADYRLGDVMALMERRTPVVAARTYPMAGVYSFGRGLFERAALTSEDTAYAHLNQLQKGDFVVSRLKAWEGAVAVVPRDLSGSFLSPEFPTYSLDPDTVLPSYWSIVCSRPWFWSLLATTSRGMGGRRERVNKVGILDLRMALPPLSQQRRIVDLVGSIDSYIDSLQRQVDATRVGRAAVLEDLLWRAAEDLSLQPLSELATLNPESVRGRDDGFTFRYVDIGSVSASLGIDTQVLESHVLASAPSRAQRVIRFGDVLVSTVRPNLRAVAAVPVGLDGEVASTGFAVLRPNRGVEPGFIWAVVRSEAFVSHLVERATGSSYPAVKAADVGSFLVKRPLPSEQRRIADLIASLDEQVAALEHQLNAVGEFRETVVSELLTGKRLLDESYDVAVPL